MKNYRELGVATIAFVLLFTMVATPVAAKELTYETRGRIVQVTDGDTVTLLDNNNTKIKIRLAGIDAPESKMAYGPAASAHLATLVLGREVVAVVQKQDRYGRTIATVLRNSTDVNLAMIEAGMAWHYKKYAREQPVAEALAYAKAEVAARAGGLGLWQDGVATPPWEWRQTRRAIQTKMALVAVAVAKVQVLGRQ